MPSRSRMRLLAWGTALLVLSFAASVFLPVNETFRLVPDVLPANGSASARLTWSRTNVYGMPIPFQPGTTTVSIREGAGKVRLLGRAHRNWGPAHLELALRAGNHPGEVIVAVESGSGSSERVLRLVPENGDRDSDGMPDTVELTDASDRRAFREWFVAIAQAQFYRPDTRWDQVHRDCAGLARFAYKEALRRHDEAWFTGVPYLHRANQPDVERYNYPDVPTIGERTFRVKPGRFRSGEPIDDAFSASASARALWEYNTVFVSRELERALPGDLLVFRDPERQPTPMHTMILLDPADRPGGARVVYHTGHIGPEDPGEVRLVKVSDLNDHRDERWHVRKDNPTFLGFYRWKILEGGRP